MGVVDFGLDIQEAVNAPRFITSGCRTSSLETEFLLTRSACSRARDTRVETEQFWGDGECIVIDPKTGERLGASDGRNNGKAVGF